MRHFVSLLARRPHFRRLWGSGIASGLGDWLSYVAVSGLAVQDSGSALGLAVVFAIHALPHALLAPLAGPVADRFDRRRLMLATHTVRALITLGMAAAASLGSLFWVQALLLLRVAVGAFHLPAARATVARVVEPEELEDANALESLTWSVLFALGVALGGVVSAFMGPVPALLADAVTFAVAAFIVRGLPALRAHPDTRFASGRMAAAWSHVRARPRLLAAVLAKVPLGVAGGGAWVTLNLLAYDAAGPLGIGALHLSRALGTAVGPLAMRRWSLPGSQLDLVGFLGIAVFAVGGGPIGLALAALAWGMGSGTNWVWSTTALQQLTPDALRGRVNGLDLLLSTLGMSAGALLGGLAADLSARGTDAALMGLGLGLACLAATRIILARQPRTRRGLASLAPSPHG